MARKKKSGEAAGSPAWLITFSDLMTLLLTFFVLLVSMATTDQVKATNAVQSVATTFNIGQSIDNPLSKENKPVVKEPGVLDIPEEDMAPLREMVFDDKEKDLQFMENKYVQIFSINSEVLFEQGGSTLSQKGIVLLDKLLPYLMRMNYPLLVAGHTANRRDEEGRAYRVDLASDGNDSTWMLSWKRAMSVYRHFTLRGIAPARLSLEAFGQYSPRFTSNTVEGRSKNRRVDLVLDKRNREWIESVEKLREKDPAVQQYYYNDFKFDLTMPGESRQGRP